MNDLKNKLSPRKPHNVEYTYTHKNNCIWKKFEEKICIEGKYWK